MSIFLEQNNETKTLANEIKSKMQNNPDFISRNIQTHSGIVELFFLKSMVDKTAIAKEIISPMLDYKEKFTFENITTKIIRVADVKEIKLNEID